MAYQNNIGLMTSAIAGYFNFSGFALTYNFILYLKTINENSYKYKFYNTVEKKLEIVKFIHHFHIAFGFEFERLIGPKKEDKISVSLFDDYRKIKTTFIYNCRDVWHYKNLFYRDRNSLFLKDSRTGKWFGTSKSLFHEATHYATKTNNPFDVSNFFGDFYEVQKKWNWIRNGNFT